MNECQKCFKEIKKGDSVYELDNFDGVCLSCYEDRCEEAEARAESQAEEEAIAKYENAKEAESTGN
jgi:hypothetical protein